GGFFALENPAGVGTGLPPTISKARCIAHKAADCPGPPPGVNPWHGLAGRQRDDLIGIGKKGNSATYHKSVSPVVNKVREGRLEVAWATCIHEQEANCHSRFALGKNGIGRVAEISNRAARQAEHDAAL